MNLHAHNVTIYNLQDIHLKDQLIKGINNESLQTDILAKANHLKILEDIIKHAEAFEAALHDQPSLQQQHNSHLAKISAYCRHQQQSKTPDSDTKPCSGCSSHNHGQPNSNDCHIKCPAWGKKHLHCDVLNHFASVCRQKPTASANALIANVHYHQNSNILQ